MIHKREVTEPEPAVSVLLPVYNGDQHLGRAIRSVLDQTLSNVELLIVDDGSTDDTAEVVASYAHDPRLRVVRHERNLGLVASLNDGLAACRAELVARLDADDVALPTRLERQRAMFEEQADLVLCASAYRRVLPSGEVLRTASPPLTHGGLAMAMLTGNRLCHSTVMFRRSIVLALGGYDAAWFPVEDYDLWLRMLEVGRYAGMGTVEVDYLENPEGISASAAAVQQRLRAARTGAYRESVAGPGPVPEPSATRDELRSIDRSRRLLRRRLTGRGIELDGVDEMAYRAALSQTVGRHRLVRHFLVATTTPRLWLRGALDARVHRREDAVSPPTD